MIIDSGVVTGSLKVIGNTQMTGSLVVTNGITGSISGTATSASYVYSSSLDDGQNTRLTTLESSTGSYNTTSSFNLFTSSYNTVSSSFSTRITNNESTGSSLTTASSSFSSRITNVESTGSSLSARVTLTESTASAYVASSSSFSTRITNNESTGSSLTTASSSFSTRVTNTETTSSILQTSSGSFSSRVTTVESKYASTGSNTFNGNQIISGSLTVLNNLQVFGSSSITYVTASQLAVSSSIISVNVFEPLQRFGGIQVYDSGSSVATASLLWDSLNDKWIYQNASGSTYSGGMLIAGPRNTGSLGQEQGLSSGRIVKSVGSDHIDNSIMSESGGNLISVSGSLTVSGSLIATSIPVGTTETNVLVSDATGNIRYRTNLSLQGATGAQGTQGTIGAQGVQGIIGAQGTVGSQGAVGAQGTIGAQGAVGSQGTQGTIGSQGTTGTQGTTGAQGTAATTSITNNTDNYVVTATGGATPFNGEANLQFDGTALTVGSAGNSLYTGTFNGARINTNTSGQSTNLLLVNYVGDLDNPTTVDIDFAAVDSNSVIGSYPHARIGYTGAYNTLINTANTYEARGYFRIATRGEGSAGVLTDRFVIDYLGNTTTTGNYTATGTLTGTILYDYNDTAYFIDPNSTSNIGPIKINGQITAKYDSSADAAYGNPLWIWASADRDAIVIQNTTSGGTPPKIYFRDTNGIIQTGNTNIRLRTGNNNATSAYLDGGSWYATADMRAPLFYDSDNTGYYLDPSSNTYLNSLSVIDGNLELYKSQTIDLSNTSTYSTSNYYPVVIGVPTSGAIIQIQNNLNSNVPSWSTHGSGFTINLRWWTNGSGWGTTEVKRKVFQYHERFTNQTICGGITQMTNTSQEVVWLRGGGTYYLKFSRNLSATAYSSTYTDYSGATVTPTSSAQNSVWNSASGTENYYASNIYTDNLQASILYDYNNTGYYFDGSATGDSIRVAGDIVAYYSDERLKTKLGNIDNPIEKIQQLNGFYYEPNDIAQSFGYEKKKQIGLSAQEVESILPEIIKDAPIGHGYKTLDYSKIVPLLVEAIKAQQIEIDILKSKLN